MSRKPSLFPTGFRSKPQMAERFANERKNIRFESGQLTSLGVLFLSFMGVQPTPAKTTKKAEKHSKGGPINTTVGKSGGY